MADDELDELYWARPQDFTAARTRLTAAAKRRGDPDAAKRISAARKPTTPAWIINRLALRHKDTAQRLADLGDRLRGAHAAMDGARIRDLTAEQRALIDELTRAALDAAEMPRPSSSVRDDLTSTLQAAIADPEIRERLGRLTRSEEWSGFGFGLADGAPAAEPPRPASKPRPAAEPSRDEQRRKKLEAAVAAAERAKAEADDALSQRQAEREAARQRRDDALASLRLAERELNSAETDYGKAQRASRAAADSVKEAKAQLKRG